MEQPVKRSTAANPNQRLILLSTGGLIVLIAVIVIVLVVRSRSGSTLDLTGNWTAQDPPATVYLKLTEKNQQLTGTLTTKNAPLPITGTVTGQVSGHIAHVQVQALGQDQTAVCTVSSSKIVCSGKGGNTLLTLTFTRS